MMSFEFLAPARIICGPGKAKELAGLAADLGGRLMVVLGTSRQRVTGPLDELEQAGLLAGFIHIPTEPTVDLVRQGVQAARQAGCRAILAIGGGSAIDAGKAIALLSANEGDIYDYLEVIGRGKSLAGPGLPVIAVPTTAGTGAEVTRNAVIGSPEHGVKVSLRSPHLLPKVALVDPELTFSMPAEVTASTGMDALTQLIEPFLSAQANPLTDALCRDGIRRAARSLIPAYQDGRDREARQDMALASLLSGLALANAKLGVVHGFASVLGGILNAPHGAICARLLAPALEVNLSALRIRGQDETARRALRRFDEIARLLTGDPGAGAGQGLERLQGMADQLGIPSLASFGLSSELFSTVIEKTAVASSTKGNPIQLNFEELEKILLKAL